MRGRSLPARTSFHKEDLRNMKHYQKRAYLFRMTPINGQNTYFKDSVKINFEPQKRIISTDNDGEKAETKSSIDLCEDSRHEEVSVIPRFNFDRKYYTSAFIVPFQEDESEG